METSIGYDDRPYLDRISSVLMAKLSDAFKDAPKNDHKAVYLRNVIATIDQLEGFVNPGSLAAAMKIPGKFSGLLSDYEHIHYPDKINIGYYRNLERVYKLPPESVFTPEDLAPLIISGKLPCPDQIYKDMLAHSSGSAGSWTGHWVVYRKGGDGLNRYVDTMEHLKKDQNSQAAAKDYLDNIFSQF